MIAHAIIFYLLSSVAILSSLMVISSKNTVHSVFFLILAFVNVSCLFIMIGAEFVGMILLIVYVGAVAVLFLFVVMMLEGNFIKVKRNNKEFWSRTRGSKGLSGNDRQTRRRQEG